MCQRAYHTFIVIGSGRKDGGQPTRAIPVVSFFPSGLNTTSHKLAPPSIQYIPDGNSGECIIALIFGVTLCTFLLIFLPFTVFTFICQTIKYYSKICNSNCKVSKNNCPRDRVTLIFFLEKCQSLVNKLSLLKNVICYSVKEGPI